MAKGGAIYDAGAFMQLDGDTFLSNQALAGNGGSGGMGTGSSSMTSFGNIFYRFAANGAGGDAGGGGVYVQTGALSITNSEFAENVAQGGNGGLGLGGPLSNNGTGGYGFGGAGQPEQHLRRQRLPSDRDGVLPGRLLR